MAGGGDSCEYADGEYRAEYDDGDPLVDEYE